MKRFSVEDKTLLINAIKDLFGEADAFDGFLHDKLQKTVPLDRRLRELRFRANEVLDRAQEEAWHLDLLNALWESDPRHPDLRTVFRRFFRITEVRSGEERIIARGGFFHTGIFAHRMLRQQDRICCVGVRGGNGFYPRGTGFLIGPDLVLTNDHVLRDEQGNRLDMASVEFRFDWRLSRDGGDTIKANSVQAVDNAAILSSSPLGAEDRLDKDLNHGWGEDALDYAVVRLKVKVGKTARGSLTETADPRTWRGWNNVPEGAVQVNPGSPVVIFQHPGGDKLGFSIGPALPGRAYNLSRTRFRYTTDTNPGSSGSPCFNNDWQLVGIHHFGDPFFDDARYNQGIPMDKIREKLLGEIPLEKFEEPSPAGDEVNRDIEVVAASGVDPDRFVSVAEKVIGQLPAFDHPGTEDRIRAVLFQALRRGKLLRLLETTRHELPGDAQLHQLIEKFTASHEDPCDTVLLKGYRLFFDRRRLRDAIRRIDDSMEPQTVYVQGVSRSGQSQTFWYLQHLKENSDLLDELALVDLRKVSREEEISSGEVFFTRPVVSRLICEAMGLPPVSWDDEYKSRDFCNAFIAGMKGKTKRYGLVLDGFRHARTMIEDIVFDMIQMLVEKVEQELGNVHIFLVDFHEELDPGIQNYITIEELESISSEELISGIRRLYQLREKMHPGRTFTDEDIARTFMDMTRGKEQDSFLAGDLSPQDVKIARILLNDL